ncbi:MAG: pantoate--beta-alanine ligase [Acidimicrobiia bacterium]|nr:pantoate--beta-alanine ligase [Acidimicrobiia bacterium]
MRELTTIAELRVVLDGERRAGRQVGLVPTMGFLHAGHASLMQGAAAECALVVSTIFVNPLQFGPGEDLESYPRDLDGDRATAVAAGVDILFVPPLAEMYPEPMATSVSVSGVSAGMEGASRPTHFDGVATVVAKLFNLAGPCRAYFGEKDFQQLAVVRRMVRDLSFPVEIVGCPTVREPDGLAMSSRNAYLDVDQRVAAPVLHRALRLGADLIEAGAADPDTVREAMRALVGAEPLARLDYVEVADPDRLDALSTFDHHRGRSVRLLAAARFGTPRLLDNVGVVVPVGE